MKPSFTDGLFSPLRAIKFLFSHPSLIRFFLFPFAINLLVFGFGTWAFIHYFDAILATFVSSPELWYQYILYYLLATVLSLLFAITFVFGFTAVGNLVASPFNDLLSEKTEEIVLGRKIDEPFSLKMVMADAQTAVLNELKKIGLLILIQLTLLLTNLIPIVGSIIFAITSPIAVMFFLAYEYMDFTLSRKHLVFGEKWRIILDHKAACLGMGLGFFFTTVIPFVNFFVMPFAVIAATRLYLRIRFGLTVPTDAELDIEGPDVRDMVDEIIADS
jgi:CysZ protein